MATSITEGRMQGKVVLVTGAGGAIGREISKLLAREGAKVSVADVLDDEGAETVAMIAHAGGIACFQHVDVTKEDHIHDWVQKVLDDWGTIDALVNNAAAFVFGSVEDVNSEDWDKVLGVNVKGYALCMKHVVPHMKEKRSGAIVNIASMSSFVAQPQFVPYNTSKGAILQLTRCTALDLGPFNIRVNCVCPGTIDTPATSKHADKLGVTKEQLTESIVKDHFLKKLGTVSDVAFAVLFLSNSKESGFITGTSLMVDGGYTAH